MTVKEYFDAIVKISDEHAKANERLKEILEDLETLLANVEEQHKPAEPLIKDENIRKAVRAWAEASGITKVISYGDKFWLGFRGVNTESVWRFECFDAYASELKLYKAYTIAELCGEEE